MKFFDKLNDGSEDEEVELKPGSSKKSTSTVNAGPASIDTEDSASQGEESESTLLPGAVGNGTASGSPDATSSTMNDDDLEEQIQRVIEQNERIIELLETISSVSSGSAGRTGSADTGNDELW